MNKLIILKIFFLFSNSSFAIFNLWNKEITRDQLKEMLFYTTQYLKNTQIKQRIGKGSCRYDSSNGDGCKGNDKNIEGEWANDIHPLFLRSAQLTESEILILDSNMFVTGAILYPLYWVEDEKGIIEDVRTNALNSIRSYKKGPGYSFWPSFINKKSNEVIIGPVNFRVDNRDWSNSYVTKFASRALGNFIPWVEDWMNLLLDSDENSDGFTSFFNVPNDADDTSVAMSLETIESKIKGNYSSLDKSPLNLITMFRDINRRKHDARDIWTPKNTGAYLTWLKDENLPIFGNYTSGVLPMGVNNVDCVVNANVVFSLALNNMATAPGYQDSLNYLAEMINSKQWLDNCALYYPQKYTFAYSVTRAYRDGGARSEKINKAMGRLLVDLIELQKNNGSWCTKPDRSCDYATAMTLVSLINIGEKRAERIKIKKLYNESLKKGFKYLYNSKQEDFNLDIAGVGEYGYRWKAGLFFSAEDYRLGVWRSTALTSAIVLEALAKYLMHYQKSNKSLFEWKKRVQLKF